MALRSSHRSPVGGLVSGLGMALAALVLLALLTPVSFASLVGSAAGGFWEALGVLAPAPLVAAGIAILMWRARR